MSGDLARFDALIKHIHDAIDAHPTLTRVRPSNLVDRAEITFGAGGRWWTASCPIRYRAGRGRGARLMSRAYGDPCPTPESAVDNLIRSLPAWDATLGKVK